VIPPFGSVTEEDITNEINAIKKVCTTGHENIVQVLNHGWLANSPYYFVDMPLCCMNLEQYIKRDLTDGLEPTRAVIRAASRSPDVFDDFDFMVHLFITSEIVKGLTFVHGRKLVHRDLKPRNGTPCLVQPFNWF
jgi:serine/threonine protein kinase